MRTVTTLAALLLFVLPATASPGAPGGPAAPPAQTWVVTSGGDTDDNTCDAAHCTLREAINHANFFAGADRITFAIPTSQPGQEVAIVVMSDLPGITEAVEIDGFTQNGATVPGANGSGGVWRVNVTRGSTTKSGIAFDVRTSTVTIRGLAIKGFSFGVLVGYQDPGTGVTSAVNDVVVTQNLIGFGPTTAACGTGNPTGNDIGVALRYEARRAVVTKNFIGCNNRGVWIGAGGARAAQITENWIGARPGQGGFPVPVGNTGSGVELASGTIRGTLVSLNLVMNNANGVNLLTGDSTDVFRNNFAANTANGVRVAIANAFAPNNQIRVRGNGFGLFSALPGFTASANAAGRNGRGVLIENTSRIVVGGTTAADRNVLAYSTGPGVEITGATATNNRIIGNYIGTGTNGEGNVNAGNWGGGVVIRGGVDNVIADNEPDPVGPIAARAHGVAVIGAFNTLIKGNRIGVSASGAISGQGNHGYGIYLERAVDTRIGQVGTDAVGARNEIAGNRFGGVQIGASAAEAGGTSSGNTVGFNAIYRNGDANGNGLGIDLGGDGVTPNDAGDADDGPNFLMNAPQITGATLNANGLVVTGTMPAEASTTYTLRFFVSPEADPSGSGEGQTPIGAPFTVQASGTGVLTFTSPAFSGVTAGGFVTATATHPRGETGEFSNAFRVRAQGELVVNSTASGSDGACTPVGTGNGCTLHEAIVAANQNPDENTITFDLPPSATAITLTTSLSTISAPVRIDGFSQAGAVRPDASGRGGRPGVTLIGGALGAGTDGFQISGSGVFISGFTLLRFSGAAVNMFGPAANGNAVFGNYIGTTPSSTNCAEGHGNGTGVIVVGGAARNSIGVLPLFGATPAPNVIGCNTTGVRIEGGDGNGVVLNTIGTRASGTTLLDLRNAVNVVVRGGATGTLVVGNDVAYGSGVEVRGASGSTISANSIGHATTGVLLDNAPETKLWANGIGWATFSLSLGTSTYRLAPNQTGVRISQSANVLVGDSSPERRNLISGNTGKGISASDPATTGLRIIGNYIGADATGKAGPGNGNEGIFLNRPPAAQIGGSDPAEMNVIVRSGTSSGGDAELGAGIHLFESHGTVIAGNNVGTGLDGEELGNAAAGILVVRSRNVRIGGTTTATTRNVIFHNGGAGIQIGRNRAETETRGVTVAQNWINNNGGLGVDLGGDGRTPNDPGDRDDGPNGLANAPVILRAFPDAGGIKVTGSFDGRPAASGTVGRLYTFQAYVGIPDARGDVEGLFYVGAPFTARADARTGRVYFGSNPLPGLAADAQITLIATDDEGNSSEFSQPQRAGTETARIKVTHGIAGASSVAIDVYISPASGSNTTRQPLALNLRYLKESASYAEVSPGQYVIDAFVAGTNNLIYTNRTRGNFQVEAGDVRMVFIGDPEGPRPPGTDAPPVFVAPKYVAIAPRGGAHDGGSTAQAAVEVFIVHGIPDGPPITVVVKETGQVLAQNLPLGQAGDLVTLEAGPATLEVRRAADNTVLRTARFDFTGQEGGVLPILVSGFLSPPPGRTVPPVEVRAVEGTTTVAVDDGPLAPPDALLLAATPNPVRGATLVRYALPQAARVRLALYDALGREVVVLADADVAAGHHAVPLAGPALAPGVYVLRLAAGAHVQTARLVVTR
jgi:CSLREA domain-containing protein